MYNSKITGLGYFVPENVVTNDDLKERGLNDKFNFPSNTRPSLPLDGAIDKEGGDKDLGNLWQKLEEWMARDTPSKIPNPPADSKKDNRPPRNLIKELDVLKSSSIEANGGKSD